MTTAAQDAANIRKALKAAGIDPKGKVKVRNTDFSTEIELFIHGPEAWKAEEVLRNIETTYPISW